MTYNFKDVEFKGPTLMGPNGTMTVLGEDHRHDSQPAPRPPAARKILLLSANPPDTERLRLDEEQRVIQEALHRCDGYVLVTHPAVRRQDLINLLTEEKPYLVHFSGHGRSAAGIVLEEPDGRAGIVSAEMLCSAFGLVRDHTRCVVLSSCYSQEQAVAVARHIDFVIGTRSAISDRAAIAFARSFYAALAAGATLAEAYDAGRAEAQIESPGSESLLCALQAQAHAAAAGAREGV